VLRSLILGISNRRFVRRMATGGAGRKVALRFVAGETLEDAIGVVRAIASTGATVSLDHLGENVTDLTAAAGARDVYIRAIDRIVSEGLHANVSVKLTQMGLDVDPAEARENAMMIAARASAGSTSVTLDMEDHHYTDRTIEACLAIQRVHSGTVGLALQAYMLRTPQDLARCAEARVHVRLCKGAYKEARAIAHHSREHVAEAYARLTTQLLESPSYAMIATHDEPLIEHAAAEARRLGRAPDSYEFQMLYGVRRELQRSLLARGFRLRVYVPFGSQWYPYLTRRIAERPANLRFFAEALARG
jgi:proline dehydrogenase